FLFKKPKLTKSVKIPSDNDAAEEEHVLDPRNASSNEDVAVTEEAIIDALENEDNDGQVAHDEVVVKSLHDVAIQQMAKNGVTMRQAEERMALKLFPAVSGLARRIHDSSPLNKQFQELVDKHPELESNKRVLDQCVPTRWNSDFDCLAAHFHFKNIIQSITGVTNNNLKAYCLSDDQWDLAEDVQEVLKLFKDLMLLFSQAEVPLVVDALPMLFHLHDSLAAAAADKPQMEDEEDNADDNSSSSSFHETPAVIQIAAHAGVLLINKYMDLTWDCEIYLVSITVMCPDQKVNWFKTYNFSAQKLREIKKRVVD
ncbi:hypothetical protein BDZ97DRAFT_1646609, partial [Flammula alnicola]